MTTCPVCEEFLDLDEVAQSQHVNGHFERALGGGIGVTPPEKLGGGSHTLETLNRENLRPSPESNDDTCFICGYPMSSLSSEQRQTHVNGCLGNLHT